MSQLINLDETMAHRGLGKSHYTSPEEDTQRRRHIELLTIPTTMHDDLLEQLSFLDLDPGTCPAFASAQPTRNRCQILPHLTMSGNT